MITKYLLFALIFIVQTCWGYQKPHLVSEEEWNSVAAYFLPENHPMKPKLDKIFERSRVTRNSKAVLNAGFFNSKPGQYSHVVVSKHFDLPGYIVKMYLDTHPEAIDGVRFKERVHYAAIKEMNR